jgi:hypothetical protein
MNSTRILLLFLLIAFNAAGQADPWAPLRVFDGRWEASVTGKPGKQLSSREPHGNQITPHRLFIGV